MTDGSAQTQFKPRGDGQRSTKPLRFRLPPKLADKLEQMTKVERDSWMQNALELLELEAQSED